MAHHGSWNSPAFSVRYNENSTSGTHNLTRSTATPTENSMMILPRKLNPGDSIGIVSPSTPVTSGFIGQFDMGRAFLEGMGFNVVLGVHVFSDTWGYAASPQEKAEDINRMFADDSIRAIICAQGGQTANACLPYLDWEGMRAHPKIFLGISDITVLLNAIQHKAGLITFHGDDVVWGFGRTPAGYFEQQFTARLMQGEIGAIPQNRGRRSIRGGAAEGKLLGGNLHCLLKLAGTPFFPDFSGALLFVEALGITPEACDVFFQQLKQIGVFDSLRGAIVGYNDGLDNNDQASMKMEDILLRASAEYNFPILKAADFGHNCPNTILPVGGRLRMDADALTLSIIEPCVV
jgi:muramoyltetrapeptide carboxypeptidase